MATGETIRTVIDEVLAGILKKVTGTTRRRKRRAAAGRPRRAKPSPHRL